nr:MAG TPA: Dephospho-CoA kinase [Caudoviricetes sp.]DAH87075.1 MAG TPA: Dephospho-CoA kinase [Caudoviricetes sp.]
MIAVFAYSGSGKMIGPGAANKAVRTQPRQT